jgi:ribosomal protein L37AE/L43A
MGSSLGLSHKSAKLTDECEKLAECLTRENSSRNYQEKDVPERYVTHDEFYACLPCTCVYPLKRGGRGVWKCACTLVAGTQDVSLMSAVGLMTENFNRLP